MKKKKKKESLLKIKLEEKVGASFSAFELGREHFSELTHKGSTVKDKDKLS